jgi:hypothetical protein
MTFRPLTGCQASPPKLASATKCKPGLPLATLAAFGHSGYPGHPVLPLGRAPGALYPEGPSEYAWGRQPKPSEPAMAVQFVSTWRRCR